MFKMLTQEAREVITLAGEESRRLGHEYTGTEHLLLGLLRHPAYVASGAPARLGLNADAVREAVANLVHRGPETAAMRQTTTLPLTPRAQLAIQMAADEAANVSLPLAGPEHLMIGLVREPDGVAGRLLLGLGMDPIRVRAEGLRVRLRQMQIVERAVRGVHASVKRKRQMREELLAHLTAICDEERSGGTPDALAALDAAVKRFGDPEELGRELQASVPRTERFAYRVERFFGWRAPESVLRMLARTSLISFAITAVCVGVPLIGGILFSNDGPQNSAVALRLLLAMALLTPATQFAFGWCYFKARDALWGAFGTRRSRTVAAAWSLAGGLVVFAAAIGFVAGIEGGVVMRLADTIALASFAGVIMAIGCALLARGRGQLEISDATWELLPVETAA